MSVQLTERARDEGEESDLREVGEGEHEGGGDHRDAEAPDDEGLERVEELGVAQEVENALAVERIAGDRRGGGRARCPSAPKV